MMMHMDPLYVAFHDAVRNAYVSIGCPPYPFASVEFPAGMKARLYFVMDPSGRYAHELHPDSDGVTATFCGYPVRWTDDDRPALVTRRGVRVPFDVAGLATK